VLEVRLYADIAAGLSFPAVALPVALYSVSAARRFEVVGATMSDMYGVARLCFPPPHPRQPDTDTATAALLLSVNEPRLPQHRSDWSASRHLLHSPAAAETALAIALQSVVARSSPRPAAAASSDAPLGLPALCCSLWLAGILLLPLLASRALCRRPTSGPLLPSQLIRASVALQVSHSAPASGSGSGSASCGSGDGGAGAGNACCRCDVCNSRPARPHAQPSSGTELSQAAQEQLQAAWQSRQRHGSQQCALVLQTGHTLDM